MGSNKTRDENGRSAGLPGGDWPRPGAEDWRTWFPADGSLSRLPRAVREDHRSHRQVEGAERGRDEPAPLRAARFEAGVRHPGMQQLPHRPRSLASSCGGVDRPEEAERGLVLYGLPSPEELHPVQGVSRDCGAVSDAAHTTGLFTGNRFPTNTSYSHPPSTPPVRGPTMGTHQKWLPALNTSVPHPASAVHTRGPKSRAGLMA